MVDSNIIDLVQRVTVAEVQLTHGAKRMDEISADMKVVVLDLRDLIDDFNQRKGAMKTMIWVGSVLGGLMGFLGGAFAAIANIVTK